MKDFNLLGLKVKDRVTGCTGVVTSISYDLYGCVQAIVTPFADKDGQHKDSRWYDTKRLIVLDQTPVMAVPSFDTFAKPPGGQKLPSQDRMVGQISQS